MSRDASVYASEPGSSPSAASAGFASAALHRSAGGGLSVRALRPLATGDPVTLDFGDRSNAELLVARGETLPHNALDTTSFHMEPSSLPDNQHRPVREALLQRRLGMELGQELHLHPGGRLDPMTVEALAILSANPAQLRALQRTEPLSPLPPAVELRALANLAQVCSVRLGRYPASLDEDEEALIDVEGRLREARAGMHRPAPPEPGLKGDEEALVDVARQLWEELAVEPGLGEGVGDAGSGGGGLADLLGVEGGKHAAGRRGGSIESGGARAARRAALLAAHGRALRLRVAEQRILEENLDTIQERIKELRQAERVGRRGAKREKGPVESATKGGEEGGKQGGKPGGKQGGRQGGKRGGKKGGRQGGKQGGKQGNEPGGERGSSESGENNAISRATRSRQSEGALAQARGTAGGAVSAGTASDGWSHEPPPVPPGPDLLLLARSVPPMLWSQTDTEISLSVRLPSLELLSPPSVDGVTLRLRMRGLDRGIASPSGTPGGGRGLSAGRTGAAAAASGAATALPGGQVAASRDFKASLQLWAQTEPLRPADVVHRGSLLQIRLRKAEPSVAAGGGAGQAGAAGGVAWPRLLGDAAAEALLRRRGLLRVDLDAVAAAIEREEADTAESERVRLNLAWLEDKWARQGRAHTNLADMIGNAEPLTSEAVEEMSALGGFDAAGTGGRQEGVAGGASAMSGLGDLRSMPGLSAEQLRRLEAGEHPSRIPGLEGGVDLEIDEAWVRQARRERRGQPNGKMEL